MIVTVPVATAQVGCMVVEAVGAKGAVGCAFTLTVVTAETQLASVVLLEVKSCAPDASEAKVTEDFGILKENCCRK